MRRVVIVGRGMAGTRMVSELRALDDTLDITVFGAEPHPPYNRILLTNVLAGKTGEQDIALVDEVDGVDVRTGSTVTAIDRERRVVHASDGSEVGYDVLEVHIPALVTLTAGANQPRYPTLKGIMQAKQKPLEQLGTSDLGLDGEAVKSTQEVTGVNPAPEKSAGEIVEDDGEGFKKIADFLAEAKVI